MQVDSSLTATPDEEDPNAATGFTAPDGTPLVTPEQYQQQQYGGLGQQAIAGLEGAAQGVIGPLAPAIEEGTGLTTPEAIRGRQEANPTTHFLSEAAGLAGSTLLAPEVKGLTLAGLAGSAGEHAAALLPEAASTLGKIAVNGVKTGAEVAALQASDELSKAVTADPNQSLQTAAINVGLAGIMGGGTGLVLGALSPLAKAAFNRSGINDLINDAKSQYQFRTSNPGNPVELATNEMNGRIAEVGQMTDQLSNLKGEALAKSMPELTSENLAKVDNQIEDISKKFTQTIDSNSDNAYTRGGIPKIRQSFTDFLSQVTDPQAGFVQRFNAIDNLKRAMQGLGNYSITAEDTAVGKLAKGLAAGLRENLEDSSVWGSAGNVQKDINAAISKNIGAQDDLLSKFTTKIGNERQIDPNKLQTYLNQTGKGKVTGLKTNVVSNYLDNTQNLANTINKIHVDAGLEAPLAAQLNPTPVLNRSLDKVTSGMKLGDWFIDKGAANLAGHAAAEGIGGGIGGMLGHPVIGAAIGEHLLGSSLTAMAKPLLEKVTNPEALKTGINYIQSVAKGAKALDSATGNIFNQAAKILPQELLPDDNSRKKLSASLDYMRQPENALNVGGSIGHYLPDHATAAATVSAAAVNYFANLKPKESPGIGFDTPLGVNKSQETLYNRQLDIAQQPLLVLQHVKDGTLIPQDIQTLNTIYPSLHGTMVQKLTEKMIASKTNGQVLPYQQRLGLSQLMGTPMDGTMTPAAMQTIMHANSTQQAPSSQPQRAPASHPKQKKASGVELKQINKANDMIATRQQSREIAHRTS